MLERTRLRLNVTEGAKQRLLTQTRERANAIFIRQFRHVFETAPSETLLTRLDDLTVRMFQEFTGGEPAHDADYWTSARPGQEGTDVVLARAAVQRFVDEAYLSAGWSL
jgi:hypothetical protein